MIIGWQRGVKPSHRPTFCFGCGDARAEPNHLLFHRRSDAGCIEEAIIGAEVEHAGLNLKLVAANEADLPSAVRIVIGVL